MSSCGWGPVGYKAIAAWVERHRDSLPTTLAELSSYPISFRRVIVNAVPHDVRVSLWTEHMRTFIGPSSALDAQQQAFVEATIGELPTLLGAPGPNPVLSEWESRAAKLFSREQAGMIFAMVGAPEPPEGLPVPADALP
jgi:hypothetical protein